MSCRSLWLGLVLAALPACSSSQPSPLRVPPIEPSPASPDASEASASSPPLRVALPASYSLTFDDGDGAHWLAERHLVLVMDPGDRERRAELGDGELTLAGTAEEVDGRWLVGVAGLAPDAEGVVVRMTAEPDGDALRGWAVVIDSHESALSVPFVAQPSGPTPLSLASR